MKNMKSKLLASVAMLLVSAIMLTSASFAWFTISTAPEITGISTQVTANGNLEIALSDGTAGEPEASTINDAGLNETWGNLVDLSGYFDSANIVLKPVAVSEAGVVTIPTWGTDGRIASTATVAGVSVNQTDLNGIYTYSANGSIYAVRVDFWLRSNEAGTITLSTAENRVEGEASTLGGGSTLTGEGITEDLSDKIKVAFLADGNFVVATRANDGKLSSDTICTLAEDTAEMVSMYFYMDGEVMDNEHFQNEVKNVVLNVQFAHSAELTPMVPGAFTAPTT
jgi:hypothetical protein